MYKNLLRHLFREIGKFVKKNSNLRDKLTKIGKNDKSTLAREGFYDLLRSYGVEKLPNKIEYNAENLSKVELILLP